VVLFIILMRSFIKNASQFLWSSFLFQRKVVRRAFWQGYSKRVMKEMGYSMSEESDFLRNLMFKSIPERLKKKGELKKLIFMLFCTTVIGIGYLHCFVWRRKIKE